MKWKSSPDMVSFTQHNTHTAYAKDRTANFSSVIQHHPPSLLYNGVLFSVQAHLAPILLKREEGEKEEERKMRHERRLPSSSHLLIAPKRGFRRPLLCKRFTCLLSRSETIQSVLRHYSTDFFITAAVHHQKRCKERQKGKKRLSLKCLQVNEKKSNRSL